MSNVWADMVLTIEDRHWLTEQLKTISNLAEIAQILIANNDTHLLATVLEYIYLEAQGMVDTHCVAHNEDV